MKYSDHYILAKYIADSFGVRDRINRTYFIWGNITPDLNKLTYLHGYGCLLDRLTEMGNKLSLNQRRKLLIAGHTAEGARRYVNKFSRKLIRKTRWSFLDWYRFGKVVHYVADRFTYPHTLGYSDGFFNHVAYEEELHKQFARFMENINQKPDASGEADGKACCHNADRTELRGMVRNHLSGIELDRLYRAYRDEEKSQENDCAYILAAGTKYVEYILGQRRLYARIFNL